jgi:hypothetical protein
MAFETALPLSRRVAHLSRRRYGAKLLLCRGGEKGA